MALATTDLATVLVVGDAPEVRAVLETVLSGEGFTVVMTPAEATADELARDLRPDLIVLDLGVLDGRAGALTSRLRAATDAAIVMLATRCDEVDQLAEARVGVDDYLTKPIDPDELAERVHAAMQRRHGGQVGPTATGPGRVRVGDIEIDTISRSAFVGDCDIDLTVTEFRLLGTLTMAPTTTFTRQMLLDHAWRDETIDLGRVDVEIANLRRKIDRGGRGHIRTVRGVGYRLAEPGS